MTSTHSRALIPALGAAQIVSWGTLFYHVAVLGKSIRDELGLSASVLFGAYTVGLITSAIMAPVSGRRVDRLGGRVVLSTGSVVAAAALATLALSQGALSLVAGYLLSGMAMSMTLYDPAFATLHRLRPTEYRRLVTMLTLFGGFASTVFWPIGSALNGALGWRGALLCFALLHLLVCLPLHLLVIPREDPVPSEGMARRAVPTTHAGSRFYWLAASFALASLIFGSVTAHLIEILTGRGIDVAHAVIIGACIGPMQVAGRILELSIARRTRVVHIAMLSFGLLATAMILLGLVGAGSIALGLLFAATYGMGNGIYTILRGVAPAEILGATGMGNLLGRLARIHLPAAALAPFGFALLRDAGLTPAQLAGLCAMIAALAAACFLIAAVTPRSSTLR
jgi:MFS family permease